MVTVAERVTSGSNGPTNGTSVRATCTTFTVTLSPSTLRVIRLSRNERPLEPMTASSTWRVEPPVAATRTPSRAECWTSTAERTTNPTC